MTELVEIMSIGVGNCVDTHTAFAVVKAMGVARRSVHATIRNGQIILSAVVPVPRKVRELITTKTGLPHGGHGA